MDPKNNANPVSDDEQNNAQPADASQDAMPNIGSDTGVGTDTSATDTSATTPSADPMTQPTASPEDPTPPADAATNTNPLDVGVSGDAQPSIASEAPTSTEAPAPAPETETPGMGMPADTSSPSTMPDDQQMQQPASTDPIPPVAPTPSTVNNDKKTIMVLGVVAVILLVAIAVLYFVV
jgi:hypothetical protein